MSNWVSDKKNYNSLCIKIGDAEAPGSSEVIESNEQFDPEKTTNSGWFYLCEATINDLLVQQKNVLEKPKKMGMGFFT